MTGTSGYVEGGPTLSRCCTMRWTLTRRWGEGPSVCFIGHNPSTADHRIDDPTSRRWQHFARAWGFGGFVAVNIYPYRSATPAEAREWADWEATSAWDVRDALWKNEDFVQREAKAAGLVVACWGAILRDEAYADHLLEQITSEEEPWPDVHVFGLTRGGAPVHPLARGRNRIPDDARPILWKRGAGHDG